MCWVEIQRTCLKQATNKATLTTTAATVTRQCGSCYALKLEGRTTWRQSFWALRMPTNCYFQASDQRSDTTVIGFGDPNFLL